MVDSTLQEDLDPLETREWQDALSAVIAEEGEDRAHFILETLIDQARRSGTYIPYRSTTAYLNTIPVAHEQRSPGDASLEWRIRSFVRWNALAMVMRANRESSELGGHIASFASAATLYDVGFNHFWRGAEAEHGADLVFGFNLLEAIPGYTVYPCRYHREHRYPEGNASPPERHTD